MDKICQNYKNSLYSGLSKIGKCLSSEKRIEILDLLVQGAKTVESISNETGMSIANTSRHLQINDSCMKIRPITLEQAYEMVKNKETLIIDLRPEDEFNSSHIENAINIPMKNLEENLKKLPKNKEIIVYCRGRNCAYANLASKFLNDNGFHAYSLNQSYYDWKKYDNF